MQYEVDDYIVEHIEKLDKYYIYFKDSVGKNCKLEIKKEIFDTYIDSRKNYIKIKNQKVRHEEQSEQTEISLYNKSIVNKISIEDIVIQKISDATLREMVKNVSKPHNRRLEMYFFQDMTIQEIALKENRNDRTIRYSISKGIDEISKKIKKF